MKFKLLNINNIMRISLIVFSLLLSCNISSQEKEIKDKKINSINLFNSNLSGYIIGSGDFEDIPDHPYQEYFHCDSLGYYVIHYIAKNENLRNFWRFDFLNKDGNRNNSLSTYNKLTSKILEPEINEYYQFLCYVSISNIDSTYGCTPESIQMKTKGVTSIYIRKNNLWEKIYTDRESDLPKYYTTQYFIKQFPEYFE